MTRSEEDEILNLVTTPLRDFALGDIKKSLDKDMLIATFMLCACFIDAVSGFYCGVNYKRVDKKTKKITYLNKGRFIDFCKTYMQGKIDDRYNPEKLYSELRNNIVHSYSASTYILGKGIPKTHLKEESGSVYLSAETFFDDVSQSFELWVKDLFLNPQLKKQTLEWYKINKV
jgi:hypothetical protein